MVTRQQLEAIERQILAPYAAKSGASRGRQYPDPEASYRTAFQRDRDRVLHTTAFRRLEYKTQVFVNYEGDYYRTRLTHTLEVAQLGRTLARALGANEDLVEAICLAHDLGHAPFGHSGEAVLNRLMKDHGGFDHNSQTLRIVTKLERRYANWPGLNLTWETREGIVKHETEYDFSDATDYDPDTRGNLEAQIANVADELAYTAHDLDDGLRAGLFTADQVEPLGWWQVLRRSLDWPPSQPFDEVMRHRLIRRLIGLEMDDLVVTTSQNLEREKPRSMQELQELADNACVHSPEVAARNRQLKDFLYENMYRHYRVIRMQSKADRFITGLFEAFVKQPAQLPYQTQQCIEEHGLHRTVCDYIAGMTDRYTLQEHERLFGRFTCP
jgi:dGTPase